MLLYPPKWFHILDKKRGRRGSGKISRIDFYVYYLDKINMFEKRTDLVLRFDFLLFVTSKITLTLVLGIPEK